MSVDVDERESEDRRAEELMWENLYSAVFQQARVDPELVENVSKLLELAYNRTHDIRYLILENEVRWLANAKRLRREMNKEGKEGYLAQPA